MKSLSDEKTVHGLVKQLKWRFLIWSLLVLVFSIISMGLWVGKEKQHIAETYFKSVRNMVIIGDLRGAMHTLEHAVGRDFTSVSYITPPLGERFRLNAQVSSRFSFLPLTVIRLDLFDKSSPDSVAQALEFSYRRFYFVPLFIAFWGIVCVVFYLLTRAFERQLIRHYRSFLDREVLRQMGEISRQVAHDIRSPLSALKIATSNLEGLNPERRDLINLATSRIIKMADDLLDAKSVLPGGRSSEEEFNSGQGHTPVNLVHAVENVLKLKRLEYRDKENIHIASKVESGPVFVDVEPDKLSNLLSNIINNSIESINSESVVEINVQLTIDPRHATILVIDNGPGIPSEILKRIGSERILGKPRIFGGGGSGIGLLDAYRMVRAWGGQIAHKNRENGGTLVQIMLPLWKGECP